MLKSDAGCSNMARNLFNEKSFVSLRLSQSRKRIREFTLIPANCLKIRKISEKTNGWKNFEKTMTVSPGAAKHPVGAGIINVLQG
jgi:hypothetical protein